MQTFVEKKRKQGRPEVVDRERFHQYLWNMSRGGLIKIHAGETARALDVSQDVVGVILKKFRSEGRIALHKRGQSKVATYIVADPETWDLEDEDTWVVEGSKPPPRTIKWE